MRAVIQRVSRANVGSEGRVLGSIGRGLVVLLGVAHDDEERDAQYLLDKIVGLRIFADEARKFNLSLEEVGGELMVVSQFTLFGDCRKGRRPSFSDAAPPDLAERLYDLFVSAARETGLRVSTGSFGAMMSVELANDGPVTLMLDSRKQL